MGPEYAVGLPLGQERETYRLTAFGEKADNLCPMNSLADRIAARLEALNLTARGASIRAGLSADAVRNIMRGLSSSPKESTLRALASALECDVRFLMGESNDPGEGAPLPGTSEVELPIRFEVAAGPWLAVQDVEDSEPEMASATRFRPYEKYRQWLERVRGDSFNKLIPDGALVHVVDALELGYAPRHDDIVVVERFRDQGGLVERSLKQIALTPNGVELWPRSYNPRWSSPLMWTAGLRASEDDVHARISGKVLRAYMHFVE